MSEELTPEEQLQKLNNDISSLENIDESMLSKENKDKYILEIKNNIAQLYKTYPHLEKTDFDPNTDYSGRVTLAQQGRSNPWGGSKKSNIPKEW